MLVPLTLRVPTPPRRPHPEEGPHMSLRPPSCPVVYHFPISPDCTMESREKEKNISEVKGRVLLGDEVIRYLGNWILTHLGT